MSQPEPTSLGAGPLSPMAGLSSSTDSLSTATSAAATVAAPAGEVQAQQLQAVLEGDVDTWLEVSLDFMAPAVA